MSRRWLHLGFLLAGVSVPAWTNAEPVPRPALNEGHELIGKAPPPLPTLRWRDGRARTLASLRGKVVVLRSFTNGCPYCKSSLPALEAWHRELQPRGLIVLGVYHPKPPRPTTIADAAAAADQLGASFPVANDPDWSLVNRWWLGPSQGSWTSFTMVLDKKGIVRLVHPGGEYHEGGGADHAQCNADHTQLRATLDRLLAE